ncbi:MAG: ATP-binding protein [Acidimicrobiales bacterium]
MTDEPSVTALRQPGVLPGMSGVVMLTSERFEAGGRPGSPRAARELVRRAIDDAHWPGDLDAAVLVTSEIVANAFRHTGSIGAVHVLISDSRLRVEAEDFGTGSPRLCAVDPEATTGRGMAIVDSLADAWGVQGRAGNGKTVWFEIDSGSPRQS